MSQLSPEMEKDNKFDSGSAEKAYVHELSDSNYDEEANAAGQRPNEELDRGLKARHIAMISIGGVIGTGLFLGTATALRNGGPIGLILGYAVMSSITYSVMMCLGEMASFLPMPGGHIRLANRFVNPALSFTLGWNYVYNWVIVLPAELSAASVLISFWSDLNPAIWIAILLVLVIAINVLGVKVYGETEFWFCSLKVLLIVGLIILSFLLDVGASPSGDRLGFRYWKEPGPFVQYASIPGSLGRFLGFWAVLIQAGFSFIGCEIVAIAAGEAKNPRRTIPKAIKSVWIRILLFYILGTLAISVIVPSNHPDLKLGSTAAKSPFVIAIKAAGIKGLPSVINAVLVTSATSAASSDIFTASRGLYSLALHGQAPRFFARTTKSGLPWIAVAFSSAFGFLAFMGVKSGSGTVFGYFSNMTSLAGLLTWFGIGLVYIQFEKGCRAQGIDRKTMPFYNKGGRFLAYYVCAFTMLICFFNGFGIFLSANAPFDTSTFVTSYLPLVLFPILYGIGYYAYGRKAPVKPEQMDFVTGIKELIEAEEEVVKPTTIAGKIWAIIA